MVVCGCLTYKLAGHGGVARSASHHTQGTRPGQEAGGPCADGLSCRRKRRRVFC